MNKIWRKPLHKRKVWKQTTVCGRIFYYMQPFLEQFVEVWLQPPPFPTLLKFVISAVLLVFLMLPIVYPLLIIVLYYGIFQYLVESQLDINFSSNIDVIHYIQNAFTAQISPELNDYLFKNYWAKTRYIAVACASCIDYMRLGILLVYG